MHGKLLGPTAQKPVACVEVKIYEDAQSSDKLLRQLWIHALLASVLAGDSIGKLMPCGWYFIH